MLAMTQHFCRGKIMFVTTKYFRHNKHTIAMTKDTFCHDKHMFVATKVSLSRQKSFVAASILVMTKYILSQQTRLS